VSALQVEKTPNGKIKIYVFNHFYLFNRTLDSDYTLGTKFTIKISATKTGVNHEYWNGNKYGNAFFTFTELALNGVNLSNCYYKMGNYQISNSTTDTSENWIYGVGVSHIGAAAADPVPGSLPSPSDVPVVVPSPSAIPSAAPSPRSPLIDTFPPEDPAPSPVPSPKPSPVTSPTPSPVASPIASPAASSSAIASPTASHPAPSPTPDSQADFNITLPADVLDLNKWSLTTPILVTTS
jgi:hypothetical protein